MSSQKWFTTDKLLKSHRSKISVIYMCNHENNVPTRLSPQWLCGNSCTCAHGVHDVHHVPKCTSCHKAIMVISVWYKLIRFSLFRNPTIQRMGNTRNILHPRCMEQDETHLHFMFYCKLSKITPHYISELINLNYSFNLPFKFSVKTIKMGSFSILWCCKFKKPTHTFRRDTHGSLQSLSWRWIW